MELNPRTLLGQLDANSPDQTTTLRYLKNQVIGNVQKKEYWVQRGVLGSVVRIIASDGPEPDVRPSRQPFLSFKPFTDQDTATLQALQLLASFANAGPEFVPPLYAAGALPAVLSRRVLRSGHHQIVLAALRVVRDFASAAAYLPPSSSINLDSLADTIFTSHHLESFLHILSQPTSTPDSEAQVSIVAHLIGQLCREERHQSILVGNGILDVLATRLASFAVSEGQVLPRAELIAHAEGLSGSIPEPAAPGFSLDEVLGAIAAIITDSPYRVCKFLCSPSILAVFPNVKDTIDKSSRILPEPLELPGLRPVQQNGYMDLLLPYASAQSRGQTSVPAFPPLDTFSLRDDVLLNGRPTFKLQSGHASWVPPEESFNAKNEFGTEEAESPLVPWLVYLIRTRFGSEMLTASSVLTSIFKAGFACKTREFALGLLVVPIMMSTLNDIESKIKDIDYNDSSQDTTRKLRIIEVTPAILARLITDSELLQKAAYDCHAVKTVCKLLKSTYDSPLQVTESISWSAEDNNGDTVVEDTSPERQLGEAGQHPQVVHRIQVRENTLRAIGALSTFKEEYRKAIIEQDTVAYIVESLNQSPGRPGRAKAKARSDSGMNSSSNDGASSEYDINPIPVVVAACYATRMLCRSVSILRTAMIDHAVSGPLFRLLRHPDIDVQNAATASVCNLVTDFSPMRESLVDAGIMTVLCEHAHSLNPALRLNALWALKHLVDSANIELKKRCVEELESGWLVQLVLDETEDEAVFTARARSERQATQGSLDEMDEDIDMGMGDDQSRTWLSSSFYKPSSMSQAQPDIRILRLAGSRVSTLREAELNPIHKARQDDLAIQEQGLGFIRNLIGGAHSSGSSDSTNDTTEMIDFLFNTLGQDRLFEILVWKLRVKHLHPFSRRGISGNESRTLQPQPKIIEAVIYILVHIAAGIPRHRQLVIAQTDLLKQLTKLFAKPEREVKLALCHLISNLTWQDDGSDASARSQRVGELKKLGFLARLENLVQFDDDLDVRERAKSALWQMKHEY